MVHFPAETRLSPLQNHSDRSGNPPSLLLNGYTRIFSEKRSGRSVKLTTHIYLVQKITTRGVYFRAAFRLLDIRRKTTHSKENGTDLKR